MTDARIEAAFEAAWNEPCLLGDPIACHNLDDVCVHETQQENIEAMKGVVRKMIVAALTAADAAAWRPIKSAPRDGAHILTYYADGRVMADTFPYRGFLEWQEQLDEPPIYWQPLPAPPTKEATP